MLPAPEARKEVSHREAVGKLQKEHEPQRGDTC